MDAVYPFLHLAKVTGDGKYLKAGIAVLNRAAARRLLVSELKGVT
jgi:hypothetical protein